MFKSLDLWLKGHLSDNDYQVFLSETSEKERTELMGASIIGSVIFLLWGILDYFFAPAMWERLVFFRCLILGPYNLYNLSVDRQWLPYNSLTKYINSLPAAIFTAWIIAVVPENGFQFYSLALVIVILATGPSRLWTSREFFTYSLLLSGSTLTIWLSTPSLSYLQKLFLAGVVLTAIFAAFGSAVTKHSRLAFSFWQKGEQIRKDRELLERRLAESARSGFMAEHLGLFLHDVKNILYHLDLMSEAAKIDPQGTTELLENLGKANRFTRNRIESFLAQIHSGKPRRELISILEEIEAVEKIALYEVRHKKIAVSFDYGNLSKDSRLVAVRGALPSVLFNMIRNSIRAIERLRGDKASPQGPKGLILIKAKTIGRDLEINVEDDGATITRDALEAFNNGRLVESSEDQGRAGLGTYAMRLETRALGGVIRMTPRETRGTLVQLKIPLSGAFTEALELGDPSQGLFSSGDHL